MKKHMRRLIIFTCLACVFFTVSGCENAKEDSGAYEAALEAYEGGDYELALSEFMNAAETDGRTVEAYRGMGLVYMAEEKYEYAVSMFDLSLSEMRHSNKEFEEDVLFYKAEALSKNLQTDKALEIYGELEDTDRAGTAYALEGKIYLERGNTDTADEKFALSAEHEKSIANSLLIYEAYRSVNLEGNGAEYLQTAVGIEPETNEDYALLGMAYYYLGDLDNAMVCLSRAVSMGYTKAAEQLGNIYFETGDIPGAKSMFNDILSSGEDAAMAYNGLAMCSMEEEDYESALVYIDLGLKCEDPKAEKSLLFNEIVVYEKMLDFDTAGEKAREYMEKYPSDETMKNELKFLQHS
jgi:tetratricopeptide (TPR) repeat protein